MYLKNRQLLLLSSVIWGNPFGKSSSNFQQIFNNFEIELFALQTRMRKIVHIVHEMLCRIIGCLNFEAEKNSSEKEKIEHNK